MADPSTLRKNITREEVSTPIRYYWGLETNLEPEDPLVDSSIGSTHLFYYPLLRIASEQMSDGVRLRVTLGLDGVCSRNGQNRTLSRDEHP